MFDTMKLRWHLRDALVHHSETYEWLQVIRDHSERDLKNTKDLICSGVAVHAWCSAIEVVVRFLKKHIHTHVHDNVRKDADGHRVIWVPTETYIFDTMNLRWHLSRGPKKGDTIRRYGDCIFTRTRTMRGCRLYGITAT